MLEVLAEGGQSLRLPPEALPGGLEPGRELSLVEWDRLARRSEYERMLARALRLLHRRERFSAELRRRLGEWLPGKPRPDEAVVDEVLTRCGELGYLDDSRALRLCLESALAQGSLGPARLRELLAQRGCPPALLREALAEYAQRFDEGSAARALLEKRRSAFSAKLRRLWEKARAKEAAKAAASPCAPPDAERAQPPEGVRRADPLEDAPARSSGTRRPQPAQRPQSRAQLARTVSAQLGLAVLSYLAARGLGGEPARDAARRFTASLLEEQPG